MGNKLGLKGDWRITIIISIFFILISCYVINVCGFSNKQFFEVGKFMLFCLIYLELFGCILMKQLCNIKKSLSHNILLSFFVGFAATVIVYIICSLFSILNLFPYIIPAYILFYIIYKWHKKQISIKNIYYHIKEYKIDNAALFLFLEFLAICLIFQVLPKVNLEFANKIQLDADGTWHVGNIAALSQGVPASDFRVLGRQFYYHYFSDLLLGISKCVFGISAYNLFYFYMPLLVAFLLSLSLWCLFELNDNNRKWFKCNYIFLAGMAISRIIVNGGARQGSLFHIHLFTNINSVAFITASMIAIIVFLDKIQWSEFNKGNAIVIGCLVGVLTGFKGPIGLAFIIAFMAVALIKGLLEKKYIKNLFLYWVVCFVSFCVVYIFIIVGWRNIFQSNIPMADTSEVTLDLFKTIQRTCLSSCIGTVSYPLLVAIMFVLALTPVVIIFVGDSLYKVFGCIRDRNVGSITNYVVTAMIYIGMGGYLLVAQSGYSQLYFLFMSIPLVIYYVMNCIWYNKRVIKVFCWIMIGGSLVFGAKDFYKDVTYRIEQASLERKNSINSKATNTEYNSLTKNEIAGLIWLRDNTDKNALVISDRQSLYRYGMDEEDIDCRFFGYSAISERQIYLEGFYYSSISIEKFQDMYEVQDSMYNEENADVGLKMSQVGAEYIIVSKRFTDKEFSEKANVICVFSNDDMDIYKCMIN